MKMNKKVIGLIVAGTIVVTNCISISCVNSSYKNEINNYKKSEEQYQAEILDLKNEIVELKNGNNDEYKKFTSANEVELSAGYYTVGEDVKPGVYNIVHVVGQGLVMVDDNCWQIGTDKEYGDAEEVKNVKLKEGDKIEVTSGLTFRFIPVED